MDTLLLIGVKGSNYQYWQTALLDIIQKWHLPVVFKEINNVDDILNNNQVDSIPAIMLNDEVLFEQNGASLDSIKVENILKKRFSKAIFMNTSLPLSAIMTKRPVYVFLDDTYAKIEKLFSEHTIHHLPVVDKAEQVIGIISKEDVAQVNRFLNRQTSGESYSKLALEHWRAEDIMTADPFVLEAEDTIGLAADMFLANLFHALPIVDNKQLVGIITSHDLLRYAYADVGSEE